MRKQTLFLVTKLTAVAAVTILRITTSAEIFVAVISALVLCCFILLGYILDRLISKKAFKCIIPAIILGLSVYFGAAVFFPLITATVIELCDLLTEGSLSKQIGSVCFLLSMMVIAPEIANATIAAIILIASLFGLISCEKIAKQEDLLNNEKMITAEQAKKITDIKLYAKTLRETTAMEERNRFAARIHDQLGHSISGSIIMLEAAQLSIDSNPEKAKEILVTATENLRSGVDGIRKSLREERPERVSLGISEIREKLEGFSLSYGIETELKTEGSLDEISPQIWNCIGENLTETLTNTLKHSSADKFTVKINVMRKLIRAEFSDNGCVTENFTKSIGLEAIEDRTAVCGGKCIFHGGQSGFSVTNLFSI